jgi:hypothetical protein
VGWCCHGSVRLVQIMAQCQNKVTIVLLRNPSNSILIYPEQHQVGTIITIPDEQLAMAAHYRLWN